MIPWHAGLPFEEVKRIMFETRMTDCKRVGHLWVENRRGAPVTEFEVCIRCGKIGERLDAIP